MSIDIFRQRALAEIEKRRSDLVTLVTNVRFIQSGSSQTGEFMPHVGAEQVGLTVIDANAEIRGLNQAARIITDVFRAMTSPPQEPSENDKGAQPDQEPLY